MPHARSDPTSSRCQISSDSDLRHVSAPDQIAPPAKPGGLKVSAIVISRTSRAKQLSKSSSRKQVRLRQVIPTGGARRDRTDDLLLAKQALSQLSYGPFREQGSIDNRSLKLVGLGRFELPTSRLSSARSNQLSYKPGSQVSATGSPPISSGRIASDTDR